MGYEYAPPNGLGAKLPDGVYEVALEKPCGIVFEELDPNFARGVKVLELVEGGNAAASGAVQAEDLLVGVSAVRFVGAKFERNMYDATKMDFDTVVDAIGSNEEKWNCNEVFLQFKRGEVVINLFSVAPLVDDVCRRRLLCVVVAPRFHEVRRLVRAVRAERRGHMFDAAGLRRGLDV